MHGNPSCPGLLPCSSACLRKEVDRFRDATGKDVGALEAEQAARGALESRTTMQVRVGVNSCVTVCALGAGLLKGTQHHIVSAA
jgi:hypothetical protein